MNKVSIKQLLNHHKSGSNLVPAQKDTAKQGLEKKHTFNQIINQIKDFIQKTLPNDLHIKKAFDLLTSLKEKYEKDIFTMWEANLQFQNFQTKNKLIEKNIKPLPNDSHANKFETINFLPLESMLAQNETKYKITLNGSSVQECQGKKLTVKTKKTLDTQKSSDNEDSKQILRWRSFQESKFPRMEANTPANHRNSTNQQSENRSRKAVESNRNVRGLDYLNKQMRSS